MDIEAIVIVLIVFTALTASVTVIGLVTYYKKRLEHKQIIAAIEKGMPLSELRPLKPELASPAWIKYITGGIIVLAVAFAFVFLGLPGRLGEGKFFVAAILCGVGIAHIIRGLLYRKYGHQIQASGKNNTVENKGLETSS